jgi:transposase
VGHIRGVDREQAVFFPETLDEYVTAENPARLIDAFVERLDLGVLGFARAEAAATGRPGYDPADLLRLYIYGYMNRVRSSRRLEREAERNVEVMWLLRKLRPDFKTIADFRKMYGKELQGVFREFTALCRKMALLGGERVAVDGSKFGAVNAREKNQTRTGARKACKEEEKRIQRYLAELDATDQEDAGTGSEEAVREKLKAARDRKAGYEAVLARMEESGETQISRTDPESRRMPVRGGGTGVCYNVQIAVDAKHHLICAYEVTDAVNDLGELSEMAVAAKEALKVEALEVLADAGYYDGKEVAACVSAGVTPMVPKTRNSKQKAGLFPQERFRYDAEQNVYTVRRTRCYGRAEARWSRGGSCSTTPTRRRARSVRSGRGARRQSRDAGSNVPRRRRCWRRWSGGSRRSRACGGSACSWRSTPSARSSGRWTRATSCCAGGRRSGGVCPDGAGVQPEAGDQRARGRAAPGEADRVGKRAHACAPGGLK